MRKMLLFSGALAALLTAGCSIVSSPVGASVEARLLKTKMTDKEFGANVSGDGSQVQFPMYAGNLDPRPVEVPMHTSFRGLPSVDVIFNGKKRVRMIADSGAELCIVDAAQVVAAEGRVYVPEKWNFTVTGVGGYETAWLARFDHARIGSLELRDFVSVVRREKTVSRVGGVAMAGVPINLLGCPVLSGFSYVTFDYAGKKFVFSPGTAFQPGPHAHRVPMKLKGQSVFVTLQLGQHSIDAMVDSGAKDEIFLNTATVKKFGLVKQAETGGSYRALGIGGETRGRHFKMPLAFVGGMPLRDVTVDTSDSTSWTARIGSEMLSRWKVTFDFHGKAMWLEPPGS
jgi:predicted aspartyl protease